MTPTTRIQRVVKTGLLNGVGRTAGFVAGVAVLPIVLDAIGKPRFGVWLTLVSSVTLLSAFDFGLGSGSVSQLAAAHGTNDLVRVRRIVSSAVVALSVAGVAAAALGAAVAAIVDWRGVLESASLSTSELRWSVGITVVAAAVSFPLSYASRVQLAMQRGYATTPSLILGGVFELVGVLIVREVSPSLVWFTAAFMGAFVAALLVNFIVVFGFGPAYVRPRRSEVRRTLARQLMRTGAGFFVLAIAGTLAYETDALVITVVNGPAAAADYGVGYRLFFVVSLIAALFLGPLWPAYAEAKASGDDPWVRRTFSHSLRLSVLWAAIGVAVVVLLHGPVLRLWVGESIHLPSLLLVALAMLVMVQSLSGPVAALLNGFGLIRYQVGVGVCMTVVNLGLSIVLAESIGVAGPPFGTVIAQTLVILVPTFWLIRTRWLRAERSAR